MNEANARVGPTSNEKESSSGLKSASERSVTDLPTANGAKEDWKEDTEHGSMRNSSIPSADPRNGTGGSIIPSFYSYPAHGSGQTNNPLGLQAHSFFPQHAPPFVNGAGINMNFPPSFLPHPSYQSLQPNPANNLASNFQPAWGADLGHSNNANGSS